MLSKSRHHLDVDYADARGSAHAAHRVAVLSQTLSSHCQDDDSGYDLFENGVAQHHNLLGDKAYVWAVHETGRLAGLYASFVKRLIETLLANADVTGAESLLAKLYAGDPLDEAGDQACEPLSNADLGYFECNSFITLLLDAIKMKLERTRKEWV